MPQSPTFDTKPKILNKALGLNDNVSITKLPPGYSSFAANLLASGDDYKRRQGRDFVALLSGACLNVSQLVWDDNVSTQVVMFGGTFYNFADTFSYLLGNGVHLVLQSPDLNYWDCTPDSSGLINPTVISAPATPAYASDFTVQNGQSFGFILPSGNVTRLLCDQDHVSWYLEGYGPTGSANITTDLVFTQASGFHFIMKDYNSNTFQFVVENDGNFHTVTI